MLKATLATATVLSLAGSGVAHAAPAHSVRLLKPTATTSNRVVGITAPADHALIKSATVPVRVKAGRQVTGVKVFAGAKDVSSRFSRRGNVFTARLPRSLFKTGDNKVLVQAVTRGGKAGGATSVSIVVPRATTGMMRMGSGASAASVSGSGPVADPGYLPRTPGQIPVVIHTKTATYARLTVNGKRAADLRANRPLTDHHWIVSVRDGLKVGKNRLAVESWDKQGRHSVKRWTVQRSGDRPLTDAGPHERVVKPGAWTTLDGSNTKATQRGATLGYAWRIVKAPKGAKPILRNATAAKPQFKPDKPGVYQFALRATQAKPGVAAAAAAGSASEDVTTVDAVPALGASGLYVDTSLQGYSSQVTPPYGQAAPPYNKLYVEGQPHAVDTTANDNTSDTFVQLDESTLAVIGDGDDQSITPTAGTITIGAWSNHATKYSTDAYGSAIWIGANQVALNSTSTPPTPADNVGNPTSNLRGWIKPASVAGTDDATWVDSDMLQVKTRLPSDNATTNTMQIDGHDYTKYLPQGVGATGGYHLIELDNNGQPKWQQLYAVGGTLGNSALGSDQSGQLGWDIRNATPNTTFLLQAFGQGVAIDQASTTAQIIQNAGGRADVIGRIGAKADSTGAVYSLISGQRHAGNLSGYVAKENSFERTGTTGSITALLVRDASGNDYIPLTGDTATPDVGTSNRYGIMPLAYAPPASWTNWIRNDDGSLRAPTAAETAAYSDLLKQVQSHGWVPKTSPCPTAPDAIRGYYCTTNPDNLETLLSHIASQLKFNASTAGGRYTEADWDTVSDTVQDEIGDVANIRAAITDYQALFGTASIDGAVNAPAIGDTIKQAINKATTVSTDAHLDNVLGALTDMASVIPEAGPPMTFLSGAFALDSALEPNTSPQDLLDTVTVTQDTAATTLVAAFQAASQQLSRYGDMLIADPAKLQQGAQFMLNNDPQTSDSNSAFVHTAEYATQQWLWGTELAPAYAVWTINNQYTSSPFCEASSDSTGGVGHPWADFANQPSAQWFSGPTNWLIGLDKNASNPNDTMGWAVGDGRGLNDISIPASITSPLFGQKVSGTTAPSVTADAGAIEPYFALDYLHFKAIPESQDDWQTKVVNDCAPYAPIAG